MEVSAERVTGSLAVGDREAHPTWVIDTSKDDVADYEAFFRSFARKLLKNEGSLKIDGSVVMEFTPKMVMRNNPLMSPELAFQCHRMQEATNYRNDNKEKERKSKYNKNPALDSYNYQKQMQPLVWMDNFMPVI